MSTDITVLFNNTTDDERLLPAHGLACLIEGGTRTLLFDTGGDGSILLDNMDALGKDPAAIDVVVISHLHWDHMGGLWQLLRRSGPVDLYLPKSASKEFRQHAEMLGATVTLVDTPMEIISGIRSTGEMGDKFKEQSLVLDSTDGAVVVTGCAHPGVVAIVERAREIAGAPVRFVLGGFHLRSTPEKDVAAIVARLENLGVARIAGSHCTGDMPMAMLRQVWRDDFVDFGCGTTVRIETPVS